MEAQELRSKNEGELRTELTELLQQQFNLRMQKGMGQLTHTHQMKQVRRDIARVRTVLHEMGSTSASKAGNESATEKGGKKEGDEA